MAKKLLILGSVSTIKPNPKSIAHLVLALMVLMHACNADTAIESDDQGAALKTEKALGFYFVFPSQLNTTVGTTRYDLTLDARPNSAQERLMGVFINGVECKKDFVGAHEDGNGVTGKICEPSLVDTYDVSNPWATYVSHNARAPKGENKRFACGPGSLRYPSAQLRKQISKKADYVLVTFANLRCAELQTPGKKS